MEYARGMPNARLSSGARLVAIQVTARVEMGKIPMTLALAAISVAVCVCH